MDRFVIVSIFIPKLRLILILNSFLGSSESFVFSELFHSLAPRPLAARSISDFLLTYLATFFFQAEDGIRDKLVTGVQTCALPICDVRDDDSGDARAGAVRRRPRRQTIL